MIRLPLTFDSGVCHVTDGDARLPAEQSPYRSRQVEEKRLTGEEEGNPLVVADEELVRIVLCRKICLRQRNPVRVRRPTDLQKEEENITRRGSSVAADQCFIHVSYRGNPPANHKSLQIPALKQIVALNCVSIPLQAS